MPAPAMALLTGLSWQRTRRPVSWSVAKQAARSTNEAALLAVKRTRGCCCSTDSTLPTAAPTAPAGQRGRQRGGEVATGCACYMHLALGGGVALPARPPARPPCHMGCRGKRTCHSHLAHYPLLPALDNRAPGLAPQRHEDAGATVCTDGLCGCYLMPLTPRLHARNCATRGVLGFAAHCSSRLFLCSCLQKNRFV